MFVTAKTTRVASRFYIADMKLRHTDGFLLDQKRCTIQNTKTTVFIFIIIFTLVTYTNFILYPLVVKRIHLILIFFFFFFLQKKLPSIALELDANRMPSWALVLICERIRTKSRMPFLFTTLPLAKPRDNYFYNNSQILVVRIWCV